MITFSSIPLKVKACLKNMHLNLAHAAQLVGHCPMEGVGCQLGDIAGLWVWSLWSLFGVHVVGWEAAS